MCGIGLGIMVMFAAGPAATPNVFVQVFGYAGIACCGLYTVVTVWRLLTVRGPVVTITTDGIRDIRIAAEFIPWTAIRKIHTDDDPESTAVVTVLVIDPVVERRLTLTTKARWSLAVRRRLGEDGLRITATGLKIGYDALLAMCEAHVRTAQGGTPAGV